MTQAVTESAARTEAVMVRQDGRVVVHFGPADDAACVVGRRVGVEANVSADPRETTCGQCHRLPEWKQAWKDAAKKVSAP
jgi:hypothetical protein